MHEKLIVADTSAIISYFSEVFGQSMRLSKGSLKFIESSLEDVSSIRMSIPSVVLVEIFEKWVTSEEKQAQIRALVLEPLMSAPNIEIRPIDLEIIEELIRLRNIEPTLDNHDMIIFASAKTLNAALITLDNKLTQLGSKSRVTILS